MLDPNLPSAHPEALQRLSDDWVRQRIMQEAKRVMPAGACANIRQGIRMATRAGPTRVIKVFPSAPLPQFCSDRDEARRAITFDQLSALLTLPRYSLWLRTIRNNTAPQTIAGVAKLGAHMYSPCWWSPSTMPSASGGGEENHGLKLLTNLRVGEQREQPVPPITLPISAGVISPPAHTRSQFVRRTATERFRRCQR